VVQFYYSGRSEWTNLQGGYGLDYTKPYELHAPKDWQPTPDTIPEGCYIKTPEGVKRLCENCSNDGAYKCPEACEDNIDWGPPYDTRPCWCRKPDTPKKEEWVPKEGEWVWDCTPVGSHENQAAKIVKVDDDSNCYIHADWTDGRGGSNWSHDQVHGRKWLRPIRVGDKVRVVDEPTRHWLQGGDEGGIICVRYTSVSLPGRMAHNVGHPHSANTWAPYEDIRLIEPKED
jgi:hypothetical protein